ncbi:MAG: glutaminyl-peptide cyclotransferase [Pseudomonadota bacterium]
MIARVLCILLMQFVPLAALSGEMSDEQTVEKTVEKTVEQFGYEVLGRKAQSRENFVQGLEIHDGRLYLSSGRYGHSHLSQYDFDTGQLLARRNLHPSIFAEGVTRFKENLYQLTWRERLVLVYRFDGMVPLRTFQIPGQGWGITHNGEELIYSDGSHRLHYMDPASGAITRSVAVTEDGEALPYLNELEWVENRVWANIWGDSRIVIIDPDSGQVTGNIDLSGLLPDSERQEGTDVLNGIARDPDNGAIWVTGKRWPWLYQIELLPR